jgi:MFS family permease
MRTRAASPAFSPGCADWPAPASWHARRRRARPLSSDPAALALRHQGAARPRRGGDSVAPLYAAGFVTAFGAHAVASTAGAQAAGGSPETLLRLGLLVAVYDLAEVFLKPLFGALSDRVGPKRVVLWGLIAFAAVSLLGSLVPGAAALVLVRFGQGAAAAAFSPAASAAVGRLASPTRRGRYFGRYGSWKSLGYASGPLLGSLLATVGGQVLLQAALAGIAAIAALWVAVRCPALAPLPRKRATVLDVVRRSTSWSFVQPVIVLSASAGALVAAVAFLPASAGPGIGLIAAASIATVLALASSLIQPVAGRLLDQQRLTFRAAAPISLAACAAGAFLTAAAPAYPVVLLAAALIGAGVGLGTPIAYATLAARTPQAELGRTMGAAELGRELGDAGAPTLVGLVSSTAGLAAGLVALGVALLGATAAALAPSGRRTVRPEA